MIKQPYLQIVAAIVCIAMFSGCTNIAVTSESKTVDAEPSIEIAEVTDEIVPETPEPVITPEPTPVLDPNNGKDRAKIIWDRLSLYFENPLTVAAIMGNMLRESRLCPWRYEGDRSEDYIKSKAVVAVINEELLLPTYEGRSWFSHTVPSDCTGEGFGLCQWTALGYKQLMFDYAAKTNRTIDDTEMQCDFLITTLNNKQSMVEKMEKSTKLVESVKYFINEYEKGITHEGDLYIREQGANCFLALYAPEYAKEEYLEMTEEEIYDILQLIDY